MALLLQYRRYIQATDKTVHNPRSEWYAVLAREGRKQTEALR